MKITTVWGFLPVIVIPSEDRHSHTRGPVVRLAKGAEKSTMAHELWHVRQFYAAWSPLYLVAVALAVAFNDPLMTLLPVPFVFLWNSRRSRYSREVAAFAEKLRHEPNTDLAWMVPYYSRVLLDADGHYRFTHATLPDTKDLMQQCYYQRRLFA